jgi:type VI protein secretion system component VasF
VNIRVVWAFAAILVVLAVVAWVVVSIFLNLNGPPEI